MKTASTFKVMKTTMSGKGSSQGFNQMLGKGLFPFIDSSKSVDENIQRVAVRIHDTAESIKERTRPKYEKVQSSLSPAKLGA